MEGGWMGWMDGEGMEWGGTDGGVGGLGGRVLGLVMVCCVILIVSLSHVPIIAFLLSLHESFAVWSFLWLVAAISACASIPVCGHLFVFTFGCPSLFGWLSLFVGSHFLCMGGHGLALALGVSVLASHSVVAIVVWPLLCITTSLQVVWHLEWMLAKGMRGDDLLWTMTTLGIVTIRQHCVVGVIG